MKRSRVALALFLATFALSLLAVGAIDSTGRVAANPASHKPDCQPAQRCPAAYAGCDEFACDEQADAWKEFPGCGGGDYLPSALPAAPPVGYDSYDYFECEGEEEYLAPAAARQTQASPVDGSDAWLTAGNELVDRMNEENDGLRDRAARQSRPAAVSNPNPPSSPIAWSPALMPTWRPLPDVHNAWAKQWHDPLQRSLASEAAAFSARGGVPYPATATSAAAAPSTASPLQRLGGTLRSAIDLWHAYRVVLGQLSRDAVELAGWPELVGRTYVVRTPPAGKAHTTRLPASFRQEF